MDVAEALDRLPMVELHGLLVLRLPVLSSPCPCAPARPGVPALRRR